MGRESRLGGEIASLAQASRFQGQEMGEVSAWLAQELTNHTREREMAELRSEFTEWDDGPARTAGVCQVGAISFEAAACGVERRATTGKCGAERRNCRIPARRVCAGAWEFEAGVRAIERRSPALTRKPLTWAPRWRRQSKRLRKSGSIWDSKIPRLLRTG